MSGDRRRARDDDGDDDRLKPGHTFKDPGAPIAADPWMPEARAVAEHVLAVACLAEGVDFGGPLSELDRGRLAEMAIVLAETNAALMKRAQQRDVTRARRSREAKAPVTRTCVCGAAFVPAAAAMNRRYCSTRCKDDAGRSHASGKAGTPSCALASQTRPAAPAAQAPRAAPGNHVPDWAARLRDRAAGYRATFQQVG
jgi:hypothetical protein